MSQLFATTSVRELYGEIREIVKRNLRSGSIYKSKEKKKQKKAN